MNLTLRRHRFRLDRPGQHQPDEGPESHIVQPEKDRVAHRVAADAEVPEVIRQGHYQSDRGHERDLERDAGEDVEIAFPGMEEDVGI